MKSDSQSKERKAVVPIGEYHYLIRLTHIISVPIQNLLNVVVVKYDECAKHAVGNLHSSVGVVPVGACRYNKVTVTLCKCVRSCVADCAVSRFTCNLKITQPYTVGR